MTNLQLAHSESNISIRHDSWMNGDTLTHLCRLAEMMAGSRVTIPAHLTGNNGDCLAVCMQAMQWGMNPFAVAQKTFMVGQTLGYEAQLVNAVVTAIAPVKSRLEFEFFGEWTNVLGKMQTATSDKGNKYVKPGWTDKDEEGVGVKVFATLNGEESPRSIDILLKQCWPRNSTQWANDPQQQITYVAVKKWARRYCPDVILGVYTPDELESIDDKPIEKDITPQPKVNYYPQADFDKNFPSWKEKIESGRNTPERIIAMVEAKGVLTDSMKKQLTDLVEEGESNASN